MVEDRFSAEIADSMIEQTKQQLKSRGAYTATGNHAHDEMLVLVQKLGELTKVAVPDLIRAYGEHLFGLFLKQYAMFPMRQAEKSTG